MHYYVADDFKNIFIVKRPFLTRLSGIEGCWHELKASLLGKTRIKSDFFSGRTTKRGGVKPPEPLRKRRRKNSINKKSDQNWKNEPLRSGGGYPDFSGPTTKKTTFLCVSSLREAAKKKVPPLMAGPLRGGGGKARATKEKKNFFFNFFFLFFFN